MHVSKQSLTQFPSSPFNVSQTFLKRTIEFNEGHIKGEYLSTHSFMNALIAFHYWFTFDGWISADLLMVSQLYQLWQLVRVGDG